MLLGFGAGPLPTPDVLSGGPAGINGDPDGVYNDSGGLLSGIDKYAGPKEGRISSDKQYQQIPHRMQHIIHMLYLPYADKRQHELVPMSHAVDQGDIAFVVNTNRIQGLLYNELIQRDAGIAQAQMPSRNAFVNLCTANYMLAGLQRLQPSDSVAPHGPWKSLALDLGFNAPQNSEGQLLAVLRLVRERLIPYGICAGSEHQGGKHETGLAPVQSAANHITSMTIDGQNRDLVNLWRRCDVSAGDQLIFRLEYLPTQSFTLNHYYKGTVHQVFPDVKMCWQLVPDLFRMTYDPLKYEGLPRHDDSMIYDYRLHGYWRIGQSFQHRGRHDAALENYSNDRCFLSGQLLQITFAPVWCEFESLAHIVKASAKQPARAIASGTTLQTMAAAQRGPRRGQPTALSDSTSRPGTQTLSFAQPSVPRSSLIMSSSFPLTASAAGQSTLAPSNMLPVSRAAALLPQNLTQTSLSGTVPTAVASDAPQPNVTPLAQKTQTNSRSVAPSKETHQTAATPAQVDSNAGDNAIAMAMPTGASPESEAGAADSSTNTAAAPTRAKPVKVRAARVAQLEQ